MKTNIQKTSVFNLVPLVTIWGCFFKFFWTSDHQSLEPILLQTYIIVCRIVTRFEPWTFPSWVFSCKHQTKGQSHKTFSRLNSTKAWNLKYFLIFFRRRNHTLSRHKIRILTFIGLTLGRYPGVYLVHSGFGACT